MNNVTLKTSIALKHKEREQIKSDIKAFIKNGGKVEKLESGRDLITRKVYSHEPMI